LKKVSSYLEEKYKICIDDFKETKTFDSFIDEDCLLFVDPLLIKHSKDPSFKGAYSYLIKHFDGVIRLLLKSKEREDLLWQNARQKLMYKEKPEFGLGYTGKEKKGSGIGEKLGNSILETISILLDAGIEDPSIFQLVDVFERGISSDRISDMTCSILYNYFLKYTARVLEQLGIDTKKTTIIEINGKEIEINVEPHPKDEKAFVTLVPKAFLRKLLVSEEVGNLSNIANFSSEISTKLSKELGDSWSQIVGQYNKDELKEKILSDNDIADALINLYKSKRPRPYDIEVDPQGLYRWHSDAVNKISDLRLNTDLTKLDFQKIELENLVDFIILTFKDLIENKGMWENLYRDEASWEDPHRESYAQNLFRASSYLICKIVNFSLDPEVNGGNGPVDFKVSKGAKDSAIIEIKKSNNSSLPSVIDKQLKDYINSTDPKLSYIIVLNINGVSSYVNSFKDRVQELKKKNKQLPKIYYVDAVPKKSASKK